VQVNGLFSTEYVVLFSQVKGQLAVRQASSEYTTDEKHVTGKGADLTGLLEEDIKEDWGSGTQEGFRGGAY